MRSAPRREIHGDLLHAFLHVLLCNIIHPEPCNAIHPLAADTLVFPVIKQHSSRYAFRTARKIHAAERAEWGDLDGKSSFLYLGGNLKLRHSSIQHLIQMKPVETGKHTLMIGVACLFKPVQEAFPRQMLSS